MARSDQCSTQIFGAKDEISERDPGDCLVIDDARRPIGIDRHIDAWLTNGRAMSTPRVVAAVVNQAHEGIDALGRAP